MSDILNEELDSAFVAPARQFNGEELAPYTEGSRLLLMQVRGDEDSPIYFIWSFVFMHIQIAKNRKDAIRLAWNKQEFREKLMDWVSLKTQDDLDSATAIVTLIIDEANKGQVEAVKQGGTPQGN
jgi:hypothetical protein